MSATGLQQLEAAYARQRADAIPTFWVEHKGVRNGETLELFVNTTSVGKYIDSERGQWTAAEKLFVKIAKAVGAKVRHT